MGLCQLRTYHLLQVDSISRVIYRMQEYDSFISFQATPSRNIQDQSFQEIWCLLEAVFETDFDEVEALMFDLKEIEGFDRYTYYRIKYSSTQLE